jgi:hypothetical protein
MIPRETTTALGDVTVPPSPGLRRRLRALRRAATRLLTMHQPVTGWRHDRAVRADEADCLAFIGGEDSLLLYDPASTTGEAWLHSDEPLQLRSWA